MHRNYIFEHCKDNSEGMSIWHFGKGKKRAKYVASKLETIPNFDANSTYITILQRNNYSILNDKGYGSFKIFFWIGSKCEDYESNFEEMVTLCKDIAQNIPNSRIRYYIEF